MPMPTKTDLIFVGAGIFLAVLTASYVPALVHAAGTSSTYKLSLENIEGIDLDSLELARQNGFG